MVCSLLAIRIHARNTIKRNGMVKLLHDRIRHGDRAGVRARVTRQVGKTVITMPHV